MDERVLQTQKWLNTTYAFNPNWEIIAEDGKTGWTTMYALTRALQIELNFTNPNGTFGPATENACPTLSMGKENDKPNNLIFILQGGLWCKGYNPGGFTGIFYRNTADAIIKMKSDMTGNSNPSSIVTPKIMKALLNMNQYVVLTNLGGDPNIRKIQQRINREFLDYPEYYIPCDGLYGRELNTGLIFLLQASEGYLSNQATGTFGNATMENCPTLVTGNTQFEFNKVLQYALYCNGYKNVTFDGVYNTIVANAVQAFQKYICLPITGVADKSTIKSLLTSNGDTSRPASACDCATPINNTRAKSLYNAGYRVVGRYLTSGIINGINKKLTYDEIKIIFNNGLRFFPIYQTSGDSADYFTSFQGTEDAQKAIKLADSLFIPANVTIYFAVDVDIMDGDLNWSVIPYFSALHNELTNHSSYKVGVYGTRNICNRVSEAGYATYSFIGDMSTGYSGNLGYLLPGNWAYDQFYETSVGSGAGYIEIDKDAYSGKDYGVGALKPIHNQLDKIRTFIGAIDNNMNILMNAKTNLKSLFDNYQFGLELEIDGPAINLIVTPNVIVRGYLRSKISTPSETKTQLNVKLTSSGEISAEMKNDIASIEKGFYNLDTGMKNNVSNMLTNISTDVKDGQLGFGIRFITPRNMVFEFSYAGDPEVFHDELEFEFVLEIALNDVPNFKFKKPLYKDVSIQVTQAAAVMILLCLGITAVPGLLSSLPTYAAIIGAAA